LIICDASDNNFLTYCFCQFPEVVLMFEAIAVAICWRCRNQKIAKEKFCCQVFILVHRSHWGER